MAQHCKKVESKEPKVGCCSNKNEVTIKMENNSKIKFTSQNEIDVMRSEHPSLSKTIDDAYFS